MRNASSRAHRSAGLLRSVAQLWTFVVASAAILAAGALVLSSLLAESFRAQVLDDSAREVGLFANAVLAPTVVRGDRIVVHPRALARLGKTVRTPDDFAGIAVWSRRGRPVFSTLPGRREVSAAQQVRTVLSQAAPTASIMQVPSRDGATTKRYVTVWSPLTNARGRQVAVVQVLLHPKVLDASTARATRTVWIAVTVVFGVLWLVLAGLGHGAAARLTRQNEALETQSREVLDASREVEQSLLDTIETLNAAVEARDPYTAGHSQRVRGVALAIGRELGLTAPQLGTLATAALFHDVGKIGIPDSILTKPGKLEPGEAAVMREHVERGAEIVAKVSSFGGSIAAIRHHHERWDGLGYPDGLRNGEIPLEAAIIALADAWDAMTTHRPYAHGLSLNEALLQIRAGRGRQFSPAVVDAFLEVARRQPSSILPPDDRTVSFAAG
jgi:putative nucleotidyltransferase with HDIG domain